jgi:hypothetical protein
MIARKLAVALPVTLVFLVLMASQLQANQMSFVPPPNSSLVANFTATPTSGTDP